LLSVESRRCALSQNWTRSAGEGGSGTDPRLAIWLWRTLVPARAASTMLTFSRSRTCLNRAPPPANDDGERRSAIVTVRDRKTVQRQREQQQMAKLLQDDWPKRSAIVTVRKPSRAIPDGWLPDTPEEHKRRGDAADALFQDMKRKIASALRPTDALPPNRKRS